MDNNDKGDDIFLDRIKAISLICEREIIKLSKEKREEILLNWWGIDHEDLEFSVLPETLRQEMLESDEPTENVMNSKYNPLLIEALKYEFIGVKNDYLSKIVSKIEGENIFVEGEQENLFACPCCQYQTLKERGRYIICPVCFWEDDGNNDLTRYSSPNRMTLAEGRAKYIKYGVVTESALAHIKPDIKERYYNI